MVAKHNSRVLPLILFCIVLLGVVLVASVLRASSSSRFLHAAAIASSSISLRRAVRLGPRQPRTSSNDTSKVSRDHGPWKGNVEDFNSTFADITAPQWQWEEMPQAPVPRLDGTGIQIKNLLYVTAGYANLDHVHSHVDIYNLTNNLWCGRIDIPNEMAQSHLGAASDGRYIYFVSGQYGPQCSRPISRSFVLDTQTRRWGDLPPLPAARYAPPTQLWRGRLHVMGGGKEDRHEPSLDHWSLAVKDGRALEKEWRTEVPIPRGGPHRACVVVNDRLMVIGGQEGDFMPKPGSPTFKCGRRYEVVYGSVYMLDNGGKWKELPPMPKPDSHIEFAWVILNNSIIIVGGTTEKHPLTKRMMLVGEVFRFNLETLKWSVIGRMPFRAKTAIAAFWDGWLYFTSGQRDKGPNDPSPKKVLGSTWRTRLTLS